MNDEPAEAAEKPPSTWLALMHVLAGQPSHFVMLVALVFCLGWFVDREQRHREQVYAPLLAACLRTLEK